MSLSNPLIARPVKFTADGRLLVEPSATSSPADYDFLLGPHTVLHRKLKKRFAGCNEWIEIEGKKTTEPLLAGLGNIERHYLSQEDQLVEAIALRLFNPTTKLWSLYWADSIHGQLDPGLQGSFDKNLGLFFGQDKFNGEDVLVQFQYDKTDIDHPVWGQAFSKDNGSSWEWNWFMFFTRVRDTLVRGNSGQSGSDLR